MRKLTLVKISFIFFQYFLIEIFFNLFYLYFKISDDDSVLYSDAPKGGIICEDGKDMLKSLQEGETHHIITPIEKDGI